MGKKQVSWVLRTEMGLLKGPFTTSQVIKMITEGGLDGTEMISRLPGTKWVPLSTEPEFYDVLLQSLEGAITGEEPVEDFNKTVVDIPMPRFSKDRSVELNETQGITVILPPPIQEREDHQKVSVPEPTNSDVIELKNLRQITHRLLVRKNKFAIGFAVLAVVAGVGLFFLNSGSSSERIHLDSPGPQKVNTTLNKAETDTQFARAVMAVSADTFEQYLKAQSVLIGILESAPNELNTRALLCFVHKELWPFAYQDAKDLQTINTVVIAARKIGPGTPQSKICEVSRLLMLGKIKEAEGELQAIHELNVEGFELLPLVSLLTGEVYEINHDFLTAKSYYEHATHQLPNWMKPFVSLARIVYEDKKSTEAYTYLKQGLALKSDHRMIILYLGLMEYRFGRADSAFSYLESAMRREDRINPRIESQGALALAKILLSRGDKQPALKYATLAYEKDYGNEEAKSVLSRLNATLENVGKSSQAQYFEFLGDEFFRNQDYLSAQAEFKTAFELAPKRGLAAVKAAKSLWLLHQSDDAIHWLQKAIQAEPQLILAYVLLADYYAQKYDFLEASQFLRKAIVLSPQSYEVFKGLALLEFRKNNFSLAISYAQRALKEFDQDIETMVLISNSNTSLAMGIMGITSEEIQRKNNALKEAKTFAERALELEPTHSEAQVAYIRVASIQYGVEYGIEQMQTLIRKYPSLIYYRIELAKLLVYQERHIDAIEVYRKILNLDEFSNEAWLGLGKSLRTLGENNEAIRAFYRAATIDPSDAEPLFQIGLLYLDTGKFDEALSQFAKVRDKNPSFPRSNYYFGRAAFELGRYDLAEQGANLEMKNNPNLQEPYLLLGEVYESKKNYNECAAIYSKAIALESATTDVYVRAARCYRLSGAYDIADNMLKIAYSKESGYADIYKEQGALYHAKGEVEFAVHAFQKYLDLSPNALDRLKIEGLIQELSR